MYFRYFYPEGNPSSFPPEAAAAAAAVMTPHHNPGTGLDLAWVERSEVNLPAVLRRAATLGTRRTVKQQWQVEAGGSLETPS